MSEKIYIGSGKTFQTQYGEMVGINICLNDLEEWVKENNIPKAKNGKIYVSLNIINRQKEDDFGNNKSVTINTYIVDKRKAEEEKKEQEFNKSIEKPTDNTEDISDDVPF